MEEKLQWSQGDVLREGGEGSGRINKGITPIDIMYMCENTNANLNTLYGEGRECGREPGESSPSTVCMHVTITMNYIMK